MRVLVFGAGVLGSYYAAKLADAGVDVTVLARGKKMSLIQEHGIILENFFNKRQTVTRAKAAGMPDPAGYDLVVVFVQRIHYSSVLPVLSKTENTPSFLFMGNNASGPDELIDALGRERVLAGFVGVGGTYREHVVVHVDSPGEGKKLNPVVIGELDGSKSSRIKEIKSMFESAGIPVAVSRHIDGYLKTHAALVVPLACALYKCDTDNYRLAASREDIVLLIRGTIECIKVLQYLGIPIEPSKYKWLRWIPMPLAVKQIASLLDSEFSEIGLKGHAQVARKEMFEIAGEMKNLAEQTPVRTPAFDELCSYISPTEI